MKREEDSLALELSPIQNQEPSIEEIEMVQVDNKEVNSEIEALPKKKKKIEEQDEENNRNPPPPLLLQPPPPIPEEVKSGHLPENSFCSFSDNISFGLPLGYYQHLQRSTHASSPKPLFPLHGAEEGRIRETLATIMGGDQHSYSSLSRMKPKDDIFYEYLQGIVGSDPALKLLAARNLSNELLMTQESSISSHTLGEFIAPLLSCVESSSSPELIPPVFTCLTTIIDIVPQLCRVLVENKGVEIICGRLKDVSSGEIIESAISALNKISEENGNAIITNNGLEGLTKLFEFCELPKQKTILRILTKITKGLNSQYDIEEHIFPAIGNIGNMLQFCLKEIENKERVDGCTTVYFNICNSINVIYEMTPKTFPAAKSYFEKIAPIEIIRRLIAFIYLGVNSANFGSLSSTSWKNVVLSLKCLCKLSPMVCFECVSNNILVVIQTVLSSDPEKVQTENLQAIKECSIMLLDSILPQKQLAKKPKGKEKAQQQLDLGTVEAEKEKILMDMLGARKALGEGILTKIIEIYEECVPQIKFTCLQIIEKICTLCEYGIVSKTITPQRAAYLINDNLENPDNLFACMGLRIAELVITTYTPKDTVYLSQLKREGIIEKIAKLQDIPYIFQTYSNDRDRTWLLPDNEYVKYIITYAKNMHKSRLQRKKRKDDSPAKEKMKGPHVDPYGSSVFVQGKRNYSKGEIMPANDVNKYLFFKSEELLSHIHKYDQSQSGPTESLDIETPMKACCHLVNDFRTALLKRNEGGIEEWVAIFTQMAKQFSLEPMMTNYEVTSSKLIETIYQSLCLPPSVAARRCFPEKEQEEVKDPIILQRAELRQLAVRHNAFLTIFSNPNTGSGITNEKIVVNPMKRLIKKVTDVLSQIDISKSIDSVAHVKEEEPSAYKRKRMVTLIIEYVPLKPFVPKLENIEMLAQEEGLDKNIAEVDLRLTQMCPLELLTFNSTTFSDAIKKLQGDNDSSEVISEDLPEDARIEEEDKYPFRRLQRELSKADDALRELRGEILGIRKKKKAKKSYDFVFYYNNEEVKNNNQSILDFMLSVKKGKILKNEIITCKIVPRKEKKSFSVQQNIWDIKGKLLAEEQEIYNFCVKELEMSEEVKEVLTLSSPLFLLTFLFRAIRRCYWKDPATPSNFNEISETEFLLNKVEQKAKKFVDDYSVGAKHELLKCVCQNFPFILTHRTRLLYFKKQVSRNNKYSRKQAELEDTKKRPSYTLARNEELNEPNRIKVKINRKAVLDDGMKCMERNCRTSAILEFDFVGENGSGIGPTLEFFSLSGCEFQSLAYLWRPTANGLFPSPYVSSLANPSIDPISLEKLFRYMGWLIARAITDERMIDLPLSEPFWEIVLGANLSLYDVQRIDRNIGKYLVYLEGLVKSIQALLDKSSKKDTNDPQLSPPKVIPPECEVSSFGLSFVLPGYDEIELAPGGANILVTNDNVGEYIHLCTYFTLHKTISIQVNAFREGFNNVMNIELLKCFKANELEELICGEKAQKWEFENLANCIQASQGYDKGSSPYIYFLQYLCSLDRSMQRFFLQYATGSSRLPLGGFSKLSPALTVAKRLTPEGENADIYFPSVMTCQNYLKVPAYSSYEKLASKFDYALREGQNVFTLS